MSASAIVGLLKMLVDAIKNRGARSDANFQEEVERPFELACTLYGDLLELVAVAQTSIYSKEVDVEALRIARVRHKVDRDQMRALRNVDWSGTNYASFYSALVYLFEGPHYSDARNIVELFDNVTRLEQQLDELPRDVSGVVQDRYIPKLVERLEVTERALSDRFALVATEYHRLRQLRARGIQLTLTSGS